MKTLSRFLLAALLAVASSVSAQSGSKIVFDAVANGQTGAMQTGAKAASVTLTFCGTGFSGNVYVDAAATQAGLAQVWTTALTGNSDCTTTYTKSPATKWYRVRWTRSAGTLNVWMLLGAPSYGSGSYADLAAPSGCATTELAYFLGSPATLTCLDQVYWTAATRSLDVTDGRVQAANLKAIGLGTPGSITVTPTLTQVGSITTVAGAALVDGDYFTIKYDGGVVPIEFDLSPGDGTSGGRIPLLFTAGDSADLIRDNVILTLNAAAPTKLTASSGGAATVSIVLDTPGAAGDTNTENVTNAGFAVTGFADPTHATTYTYKLVARLADDSTTEAGAASTTAAGHATLSAANYNALSWSAVTGAASYDVYRTVGGATQGKILSAAAVTALNDTGLAGGGETAPTVDGTGRITSDALTSGRVAIIGTGGRIEDDAGLTYDAATDALTVSGKVTSPRYELDVASNFGAVFSSSYTSHGALRDILWTNNLANGTTDLGLSRAAAGVLKVTDGSTGLGFVRLAGQLVAAGAAEPASVPDYRYANGYYSADTRMSSGWEFGWGPNANTTSSPSDTILTRAAAATLQLGAANAASPVAQTLQAQGSRGGTDTNVKGANMTQRPGAGTGSAGGGDYRIQRYPSGASGTTQNVAADALVIASKQVTLTESSATAVLDLAVASGSVAGGTLYYTIRADDSTDFQAIRGSIPFTAVNKGGTLTATVGTAAESVAVSTGTLTNTVTITTGTNSVTLNLNAVSSLTQTTLHAYVSALVDGTGVATTK